MNQPLHPNAEVTDLPVKPGSEITVSGRVVKVYTTEAGKCRVLIRRRDGIITEVAL
jgi:hypothetical protein